MRLITIALTIILISCNYINTDKRRVEKGENYREFFYENKDVIEQLTTEIQNNEGLSRKLELIQNTEALEDEEIKNKLRQLDIKAFSISKTNCGQLEVEYMTSWTDYPIGQLYLNKACTDDNPKKGTYSKSGFIEVWGLGDGWTIWIDSDPI